MADISYTVNASCTYNGQTVSAAYTGTKTLATGAAPLGTAQTIGTIPEALTLGDTPLPALVVLQNVDAANFVEVDLVNPLVKKQKLYPAVTTGANLPLFLVVEAANTVYL